MTELKELGHLLLKSRSGFRTIPVTYVLDSLTVSLCRAAS